MTDNDLREMLSANVIGSQAFYLLGLIRSGIDIDYNGHFNDPGELLEAFKALVDLGVLVVAPDEVSL